ncbi:helix-turn-helix transcriptional regulator [Chryseobacterium echinoideorum]|uniref:helix-turn-helix transcriptional regulator n=1 Tax=Chryseobacterium echinoideorum TaxID=1549648 RepID=UPI001185E254|nr:WYL domain-containing protein [Chryseobacterium echinoideorum]
MKKDFYLTRYALIIKKLESAPSTYSQIEEYLLNSFEFQDAEIKSYSMRTLQRDIREISNLFNLTIHNKKRRDNRYYIDSRPMMEVDEYNQKLLESFQVSNALNLHPDFSDFIFFESRKPTGLEHFYDLFFAIRNKRIVLFEHYNYKNKKMTSRKVHPLALKESKDRWYLIAVDTKDKTLKSFGLDRINHLSVAPQKFREKYKYNFREHFKNAFGVMNLTEQNPQKIVLKCSRHQGEYIRSFPLHQSQKELKETSDDIYFEFFLHPTYDFRQEILSYGKEVKVMEPESLIREIRESLSDSLQAYSQE